MKGNSLKKGLLFDCHPHIPHKFGPPLPGCLYRMIYVESAYCFLFSSYSLEGIPFLIMNMHIVFCKHSASQGTKNCYQDRTVQIWCFLFNFRYIIEKLGIACYTTHEIDKHGIDRVMEHAMDAINPDMRYPMHVSFDVDALDPTVAPSTTTPGKFHENAAHYG